VILFLARLVRILIVLVLLRLVLRFVAAVVQGYREAGRRPAEATEMVRDRVCGTFLPRARALVATLDGRERYFCSPECRERARAARLPAAT
jgi:YHS domain-containing protein